MARVPQYLTEVAGADSSLFGFLANLAMKPSENSWPSSPRFLASAYWDAEFFAREQRGDLLGSVVLRRPRRAARRGRRVSRARRRGRERRSRSRPPGRLRAHLNLCRHRGSRLLCGEGVVRGAIRCPYHSWAYALDGRLVASPFVAAEDVPRRGAAAASRRRRRMGRLSSSSTFARNGRGRRRDAGRAARRDSAAVRRAIRSPSCGSRDRMRYDVAANWKVMLENYNECYHCAGVHPELCRVVPAFKRHGGARLGLGARHPAPRRRVDVHRERHERSRAPFATLERRRAACATRAS